MPLVLTGFSRSRHNFEKMPWTNKTPPTSTWAPKSAPVTNWTSETTLISTWSPAGVPATTWNIEGLPVVNFHILQEDNTSFILLETGGRLLMEESGAPGSVVWQVIPPPAP
jgi:hypothetical protein